MDAPSTIAVVCLGDLGRSPRMQYHTLSMLTSFPKSSVYLMGFPGEALIPALETHGQDRLHVRHVDRVGRRLAEAKRLPWIVRAPLRSCTNAFELLTSLIQARPDLILIQNPPSVPTMLIVGLYRFAFCPSTRALCDWHNLGYSMLEHSKRPHWIVRAARIYEMNLARWCFDKHLSVTAALRAHLAAAAGVPLSDIVVLRDRPHASFKRIDSQEERSEFLLGLARQDETSGKLGLTKLRTEDDLLASMTKVLSGEALLCVSATSWTEDEDFRPLLDALDSIDALLSTKTHKELFIIVTGKGPLRSDFQRRVQAADWKRVVVATGWLAASDYPKLLGSADWGLSMHTSTSGLDLPMKVVDMFGAKLPVLAAEFSCIRELVVEGAGIIFNDARELGAGLLRITSRAEDLRASACQVVERMETERGGWDDNWRINGLGLTQALLEQSKASSRVSWLQLIFVFLGLACVAMAFICVVNAQ